MLVLPASGFTGQFWAGRLLSAPPIAGGSERGRIQKHREFLKRKPADGKRPAPGVGVAPRAGPERGRGYSAIRSVRGRSFRSQERAMVRQPPRTGSDGSETGVATFPRRLPAGPSRRRFRFEEGRGVLGGPAQADVAYVNQVPAFFHDLELRAVSSRSREVDDPRPKIRRIRSSGTAARTCSSPPCLHPVSDGFFAVLDLRDAADLDCGRKSRT